DGMPSPECGKTNVADFVDALFKSTPSVKTFVIGFGDGTQSNPDLLNSWAVAGHTDRPGATKYFQSNSQADLKSAFDQIAGSVSCSFKMMSTPPDPKQLYVW